MDKYNNKTCDLLNCKLRTEADPVRHLIDAHKIRPFTYEEIPMVKAHNITSPCFFELLATAFPLKFASPYDAQQFTYNTIAKTYSDKTTGSYPTARQNFTTRFFNKTGRGGMQFEDLDVISRALNCAFSICATKVPKLNSRGTNTKFFEIGQSTDRIYINWVYDAHYQLIKPIDDTTTTSSEDERPLIRYQTHPLTSVNGKPEYDEFKSTILNTPNTFKSKRTLQDLTPIENKTPPISEDDEEITVAVNLVREHLLKDFFPGLDTHIKIAVATSIASSIVSVSANISALIGGKLGSFNKAVQITSIITSLTSFTANVSLAFRAYEIKFNFDKVVKAIPGLSSMLHSTFKANSAAWIYPTISALVSLIIGGLTIFNVKEVKEIIQAGALLKTINTFGGEAKQITKYVLEDLLELDIKGDHIQHKALIDMAKRSAELCVLPHYKFFGDPGLLRELQELSSKATDLTAKKFADNKTSQVARITAQTLMNNVSILHDKELAIKTVFDTAPRQETFGVLLAGKPSIGKSYLLTQIWAKLAPIFDYKKDLYNLTISRSDGFFEPYGMQDCGFVNEFMGSREDPFLTHLNSTISADPKNLEGAFQKSQPAQFKLVFLTSNDVSPELTRHLTHHAAEAVWNRLLRIEIEDPQCQGRQGINSHRKTDFSHLTIKKVMDVQALSKEKARKSLKEITLDSLIVEIAHQIARREKAYLTSIMVKDIFTNEQEQIRKRISRLDAILATTNWANAEGGTSFNIVRIQGPLETGKTELAKEIASAINSVYYKRNLVIITQPQQFSEKPSHNPKVYLLDDVIDETTHNDYFKWINSCNPESLFIITSNTTYIRELRWKDYCKTKALNCFGFQGTEEHFYIDTRHTHSGLARRLGLYGRVDAINEKGHETVVNNPDMQLTIDAAPGFQYKINGTPITPEDLKTHIFRTYTAFISKSHKIQILNTTFCDPEQEYDVKITADNLETLHQAFSSITSVTSLLFFGATGANVTISPRVMTTIPRDMKDATALIPNKKLETREDVISLAKRLGAFMTKLIPDIKIYFHLKGESPIVLVNKQLFIGAINNIPIDIVRSPDSFHWVFQGRAYQLRDEDFALFTATGILPPIMQTYPQFIIAAIVAKYTSMRHEETPLIRTWIDHYRVEQMIKDYKERGLLSFLFEHKALTLCAGILGIATLTTLSVKLYRYLNPQNQANSSEDEDDSESSYYKDIADLKSPYRNALMSGDRTAIDNIRAQARESGRLQKLNQWEHTYRSNSYLTRPKAEIELMIRESINNQDLDSLSFFIKFDPETVKSVISNKPNMLTAKETKHQMPTIPQIWIDKLKRNYVLVTNSKTHARVYGLGLCNKTIVTVSHIFHDVGEECIIQSDGKQYKGICKSIQRRRDLAMVEVEDATFPSFRDLRSTLVSHQEFSNFSTAWFVRPTDKPLIYSATTQFKGRSAFIMTDNNNPLYTLNYDYWEFHLIGMKDLTNTFSSGDCGFPLIAMYGNNWKIIGIHNSINGLTSTGFFSSISTEDLCNISNSDTSNKVPHILDSTTDYVIDSATFKALTNQQWKDSKYEGVSPLKIVGYNAGLNTYSSPHHKKKYISICEPLLDCETLPSALDMSNVTDTSKLVADKRGEFYPLFSQAVKYTKKTELYGQFEQELFDHVQESIKHYYDMNYGEAYMLRLKDIINGYDNLKSLDMTTSAGPKMKREFGVNIKMPTTGQKDILFINHNEAEPLKKPFYSINTKTKAGNALMQDFHHYSSAIDAGDPILLVIKDNAKVELLPAEKVREGKVRLFNEMDLSVNMVLKSYFGGFLNSVISKHDECMYTIGFNPYKEATLHMLDFNMIDGEVVSSDFSGLDKSFPKELIFGFVNAVSRGKWSEQTERAIAKTLTYTYHSLNGHIYPVDCGNESGSYVTTIMNCYAVHFVNWYTFARKWRETYNLLPSLKDFEDNFCQKILGDDCIRKISKRVKINFDDLAIDASRFNLTLTRPKIEGEVSFCSRVYKEIRPNIYAPCLKTASITSCLFYLASETTNQISMNINVALFEASLHGKEYFEKIAKGAMAIAKHYNIPIDLYPHKSYVDYFIGYVINESKHPTLQAAGSLIRQSIESNASFYSTENILQQSKFKKMADMWLNEYVQKNCLATPCFTFSMDGTTEWNATVTLKHKKDTYEEKGHGRTKQLAKREACEKIQAMLTSEERNIGTVRIGSVERTLSEKDMEEITKLFADHFKIKGNDFAITIGTTNKANGDTPIEPATISQASRFQNESTLPNHPNPQPTGIAPAMVSSGEDIQAAIMGTQQTTLNPIGAPDMSTVGAIQFDLKHLSYEQDIDADTEIEVSADMPAGTVVAQIPYGWNHPYLNRYAKRWILQHERYTGSLKYRFTVIGNPLFSGALGIAWAKKRLTSSIVPVSTMQKYAYSAKGVTMPWNVTHTLHDARKNDFYREVSDDLDDANMADRPHLILFLLMSLQNPLQPGVITRVRIASRLATAGEGNAFKALDPRDDELAPETTTTPIPQSRFQSIYPQDLNKRIWLYTDGQLSASTSPTETAFYPDMDYAARKNGIIGGQQGQALDTGATYYNVENWAKTDTVSTLAIEWPWMAGKSVDPQDYVTVYISTLTNMDQESFYKWINNNNWPGFQKQAGNAAMTMARWDGNKGYIPNVALNGINTHSCTYNQAEITFSNNISPQTGNGFSNTIKEWIKYVTDKGTIYFMLCYTQQLRGTAVQAFSRQVATRFAGHYQTNSVTNLPNYPIFNVDEQLGSVNPTINTLPSGNLLFRMTEMPPSAVAVGQAQMPTCNDNATIAKQFALLAQGLSNLQCIQFRLLDAQSVRTIAVVRYLQESKVFVINAPNAPTRYRVIPQNNVNIIVGQITIVQRATDFQETTVFDWTDRVAPEFLRRDDQFKTPIKESVGKVTPIRDLYGPNSVVQTREEYAAGNCAEVREITAQQLAETGEHGRVTMPTYEQYLAERVKRGLSIGDVTPTQSGYTSNMLAKVDFPIDYYVEKRKRFYEEPQTSASKQRRNQSLAIGNPLFPGVITNPLQMNEVTKTQGGYQSNATLLASMVGGGMSGVGQAIGQHQERKHQKELQSNQFSHNELMQGNMFDFQNQFQQQGFDFQKLMQENQFGFQNEFQGKQHAQEQLLQERGYQNEMGLLQSSHQEQRVTNKEQSRNRMMERGLSSRVMGVPGATTSSSYA